MSGDVAFALKTTSSPNEHGSTETFMMKSRFGLGVDDIGNPCCGHGHGRW